LALLALFQSAAQAERSVTLAWNPSPDASVAGYYVYSLEENSLSPAQFDAGPATQMTVTGLKEGMRYGFTVTARNAHGVESLPSQSVSFVVPVPLKINSPLTQGGACRLQFPVAPGHWYELQASTDLQTWETIALTGVANVYSSIELQDTKSRLNGKRFYRLQVH